MITSAFCSFSSDGLGISCARCGSWRRGDTPPDCPPYITRSEPDGTRLPHITTAGENSTARDRYFDRLEEDLDRERKHLMPPSPVPHDRNTNQENT
jgi:hypothetical protein